MLMEVQSVPAVLGFVIAFAFALLAIAFALLLAKLGE